MCQVILIEQRATQSLMHMLDMSRLWYMSDMICQQTASPVNLTQQCSHALAVSSSDGCTYFQHVSFPHAPLAKKPSSKAMPKRPPHMEDNLSGVLNLT